MNGILGFCFSLVDLKGYFCGLPSLWVHASTLCSMVEDLSEGSS